jgi:subtilisin family serine protease
MLSIRGRGSLSRIVCAASVLSILLCLAEAAAASARQPRVRRAQRAARAARRPALCPGANSVPKEWLVRFADDVTAEDVRSMLDNALGNGLYRRRRVGVSFNVYAVRAPRLGASWLAQKLTAESFRNSVLYVEPNAVLCLDDGPDDPLFNRLWGLMKDPGVDAVGAWDHTQGSERVVVGVVDTGIDVTHPDLRNNLWRAPPGFAVSLGSRPVTCPPDAHGYDALRKVCVANGRPPYDSHGHGTHVSGVIGAEGMNRTGIVGVNWHTSLMTLRAFPGQAGHVEDVVEAIEFAIQAKRVHGVNVRVLNNSYGTRCRTDEECPSRLLEDMIRLAAENDILFVASAGESRAERDNDAFPHYPSNFDQPNIISVAWTTSLNELYDESHFGLCSVDLGAPGSTIVSTWPFPNEIFGGQKYKHLSGTSMAAAYVSGAAALVLSRCPDLDTGRLKDLLLRTVDPFPPLVGKSVTGGRLNVYKAVTRCVPP